MALHDAALAARIGVAPGHLFSPDRRFSNCVRINCGHAESIVLPAIRQLGAIAHELRRTSP
jgi:DNA-binding transcriptional MocR family regulator